MLTDTVLRISRGAGVGRFWPVGVGLTRAENFMLEFFSR